MLYSKLLLPCGGIINERAEKTRFGERKMDESAIPTLTEFDILKDFELFRDDFGSFRLPAFGELPDVGLYMDQVVSLIDKYLLALGQDDDRPIITSSMVNNYVKLGFMPAPEKKRYYPGHIAYLIMICLLKQVLSMHEIKILIDCKVGDIREKYENFRSLQQGIFADLDVTDASDPLALSLMALATKLCAQKILKIQLEAIREETEKLAPAPAASPSRKDKKKKSDPVAE